MKHKKERRNKSKPSSNKLKRWTTKQRLDKPNDAATEICLHLMNVGTTQNLLYNSLRHTRSCVRIKGRRSGTVPSCTIRVKFLRIPLKLPRADVSGSSCKPAITRTFIMDTCQRARQTMTPFFACLLVAEDSKSKSRESTYVQYFTLTTKSEILPRN